jgi:hypothetical protein
MAQDRTAFFRCCSPHPSFGRSALCRRAPSSSCLGRRGRLCSARCAISSSRGQTRIVSCSSPSTRCSPRISRWQSRSQSIPSSLAHCFATGVPTSRPTLGAALKRFRTIAHALPPLVIVLSPLASAGEQASAQSQQDPVRGAHGCANEARWACKAFLTSPPVARRCEEASRGVATARYRAPQQSGNRAWAPTLASEGGMFVAGPPGSPRAFTF